jgi:hypothetical protein
MTRRQFITLIGGALPDVSTSSRARVSFAHFGGTAVSARQTEFALGERDA